MLFWHLFSLFITFFWLKKHLKKVPFLPKKSPNNPSPIHDPRIAVQCILAIKMRCQNCTQRYFIASRPCYLLFFQTPLSPFISRHPTTPGSLSVPQVCVDSQFFAEITCLKKETQSSRIRTRDPFFQAQDTEKHKIGEFREVL